jgi:hypothetical protein
VAEIGDHLEVVEAQKVITVAAMAPARSSFPPMNERAKGFLSGLCVKRRGSRSRITPQVEHVLFLPADVGTWGAVPRWLK